MKKNDTFPTSLSHTEIITFAISYLVPKCIKYVDQLSVNDPEVVRLTKEIAKPWFFKLKKLCELYELETGTPYCIEADGIDLNQLDI